MNSGHPGRWPSHLYLSSVWEQRELIIQPPFFTHAPETRAILFLSCVTVNKGDKKQYSLEVIPSLDNLLHSYTGNP